MAQQPRTEPRAEASSSPQETCPDGVGEDPSTAQVGVDVAPVKERFCIGASLLLFSIDPQFGVPAVLLAREKKRQWLGNNSNIFTDFGGGAESDETAEEIAAREFVEESLGSVRYFDRDTMNALPVLARNVAADLAGGGYLARIETAVSANKSYVTFMKQVPFQPRVCGDFRRAKDLLHRARGGIKNLAAGDQAAMTDHPAVRCDAAGAMRIACGYLEKQGIEYFSLHGLEYWLSTGGHNLNPAFKCMSYMKGRLRVCVGHLRCCLIRARRLRSQSTDTDDNKVAGRPKPSYTHFPHQQHRLQPFDTLRDADVFDIHQGDLSGWPWSEAGARTRLHVDANWPRHHASAAEDRYIERDRRDRYGERDAVPSSRSRVLPHPVPPSRSRVLPHAVPSGSSSSGSRVLPDAVPSGSSGSRVLPDAVPGSVPCQHGWRQRHR